MEKNENGYPITQRGTSQGGSDARSAMPCEGGQLAMVYSPKNEWRMIFSPADALCHGTLFEELYKPLDY
ncbi:MAG: spore coat associated protein CotJA [Clostridia bacterium]|nr:spore coat associated protein CotJA [Clostridia bacterium]